MRKTDAGNLSCTSSRWSKTLQTSTFSLRFLFPVPLLHLVTLVKNTKNIDVFVALFIFCQATLSEHATPMNPKPHVELDTCGSLRKREWKRKNKKKKKKKKKRKKTVAGNLSCTSSRWSKTLETSTFALRFLFPVPFLHLVTLVKNP